MPRAIMEYTENDVDELVRRDAQSRLGTPVMGSQIHRVYGPPHKAYEIRLRDDQIYKAAPAAE